MSSDITDAQALATCAWINEQSNGHYYLRHVTLGQAFDICSKEKFRDPKGMERTLCRGVHTIAIECMLKKRYKTKREFRTEVKGDISELNSYLKLDKAREGRPTTKKAQLKSKKRFEIKSQIKAKYRTGLIEFCRSVETDNGMRARTSEPDVFVGSNEKESIDPLGEQVEFQLKQMDSVMNYFSKASDSKSGKVHQELEDRAKELMDSLYQAVLHKQDPRDKLKDEMKAIEKYSEDIRKKHFSESEARLAELEELCGFDTEGKNWDNTKYKPERIAEVFKKMATECAGEKEQKAMCRRCLELKDIAVKTEHYLLANQLMEFLKTIRC